MEECCCKKTIRDENARKRLLHRLNRIEGQIRGLKNMIENDVYCNDILVQSAAVNSALHSFDKELLSQHIHGCVATDIKNGNEDTIDELVDTINKLMK